MEEGVIFFPTYLSTYRNSQVSCWGNADVKYNNIPSILFFSPGTKFNTSEPEPGDIFWTQE